LASSRIASWGFFEIYFAHYFGQRMAVVACVSEIISAEIVASGFGSG